MAEGLHKRLLSEGWRIEEIVSSSEETSFAEEVSALGARIALETGRGRYAGAMIIPLRFVMEDGLTLADETMHALYIKPGKKYGKPDGVFCPMIKVINSRTGEHLFYKAPSNEE